MEFHIGHIHNLTEIYQYNVIAIVTDQATSDVLAASKFTIIYYSLGHLVKNSCSDFPKLSTSIH